jgi:hypothetical protein
MADGGRKKGSGNGFQGLGLSDPVYHGIVRMGFRVSVVCSTAEMVNRRNALWIGSRMVLTDVVF